jgi:two-component system, OmpR family, sensor kinase
MPEQPAAARSPGRIRQFFSRTPLRVKLISAVVAMVAIALVIISVAGISALKGYLLGQADSQLQSVTDASNPQHWVGQYLVGGTPLTSPNYATDWVPAGGRLRQVVLPILQQVNAQPGLRVPPASHVLPGPGVPASPAWLAANLNRFVTVPATSGGGRWRIYLFQQTYQTLSGSTVSGTVIVGVDVTSAYTTTGRLAAIDLIVSAAIVLLVAIVGIALVRASLRPLTEIEKTAEAIAAGDMTRRVPDRDPRTEVGRLGRSLNTMLARIEAAFDARAESEHAARRSEDKMRQFVADASHELRTPLTAIRGFAEYYRQRGGLADTDAPAVQATGNGASGPAETAQPAQPAETAQPAQPAETAQPTGQGLAPRATETTAAPASQPARHPAPLARADLDRIMLRVEQESSRMGVLVEDMLLLARLDQQRPLDFRPVDMLTLAADAVHDARVVAPDRTIELTVGTGAALIVLGDEVRLRQVIGNLMSNALTHTPDQTAIEVRVRSGNMAEARMAPIPAVTFEVADHGPGLTPQQAEHVFERFYRADQARTRKAGGTGLGLAIVAALVAAHGGAVWVESRPGGGATFRIALPLAPEARQSDPEPDDQEPGEKPGEGLGGQDPGQQERDELAKPHPDLVDEVGPVAEAVPLREVGLDATGQVGSPGPDTRFTSFKAADR